MSVVSAKGGPKHMEQPVEIVAYDSTWSLKFEAERTLLERVLAPWLAAPVEHIGSTAVPTLSAKPIIDIMAPVRSLSASVAAIEAVAQAGYQYYPYKADVMHWFCKPAPDRRTHHLHLVPYGSEQWNDRLAFRNALRESPKLASEYVELKRRLAREFRLDREAYTEGKTQFVNRVLASV